MHYFCLPTIFLAPDFLPAVQTWLFYLYAFAWEYIYSGVMKQSGVKEDQFNGTVARFTCLLLCRNLSPLSHQCNSGVTHLSVHNLNGRKADKLVSRVKLACVCYQYTLWFKWIKDNSQELFLLNLSKMNQILNGLKVGKPSQNLS